MFTNCPFCQSEFQVFDKNKISIEELNWNCKKSIRLLDEALFKYESENSEVDFDINFLSICGELLLMKGEVDEKIKNINEKMEEFDMGNEKGDMLNGGDDDNEGEEWKIFDELPGKFPDVFSEDGADHFENDNENLDNIFNDEKEVEKEKENQNYQSNIDKSNKQICLCDDCRNYPIPETKELIKKFLGYNI